MKNHKALADAINAYKKEIPLPLKLKEVAEDFTDLLFKVLFDTQTDTLEGIQTIHDHFEEMVALACWKPEANCQSICEAPGIRKWPQEYLPKIFNPSKVDRILEVNQQLA